MQLKTELGKQIQAFRKQKGMTQEQLANLVGIDSKNISKIENGINYPSAETLTSISQALEIEVYELFWFNRTISYEEMKEEIIKELDNKNSILYLYKIINEMKKQS